MGGRALLPSMERRPAGSAGGGGGTGRVAGTGTGGTARGIGGDRVEASSVVVLSSRLSSLA